MCEDNRNNFKISPETYLEISGNGVDSGMIINGIWFGAISSTLSLINLQIDGEVKV
jgi:hypothetical protein